VASRRAGDLSARILNDRLFVKAAAQAKLRAIPAPAPPAPPAEVDRPLRRLLPFLVVHRRNVSIALAAAIAGQAVAALTPVIERAIIDDVLVVHRRSLIPLMVLLIGSGLFGFGTAFVRRFLGGRVSLDVSYDMRNAIYDRLQRLDFATHDRMETGQVVARASGDVGMLLALLQITPLLLGNVVLLIVSLVVMTVLSPPLTLVALLVIPALFVAGIRMRRSVFPATWDAQQHLGHVAGVVDEAVTGVRIVKGFGQEQRELVKLTAAGEALYRSRARLVRIAARFTPTLSSIPVAGQVAVLAFGGWLALHGRLSLGTFLAFSSYLLQMVAPVRMLATTMALSEQARAASARLLDILDAEPEVVERSDAVDLPACRGAIHFDNVSFGYRGSTHAVLDGFELTIAPGETVAIFGATGCGKSTVAMLIPRYYDVTAGRVTIDGIDVRDLTFASLRRAVGVVFEESFLFSDTVRENLSFGAPQASEADIAAVARAVAADGFIDDLPDGYETVIGERGLTLSGGQRQRIALARALLTNPSVLLLDDATSSIDAETEERILRRLREIDAERTTIVIAHRRSTLRLATRIVVVDGGKVAAEGSHDQLLLTSALYRQLLNGPTDGDEGRDDGPTDDDGGRDDGRDDDGVSAGDPGQSDGTHDQAWPYGRTAQSAEAHVKVGGSSPASHARGGLGGIHDVASALSATPQLLDALAKLAPADDDADVDVAAQMAAPASAFSVRRFTAPFRAALTVGLGLVLFDTGLTLLGPFLIRQGIDRGIRAGSEAALFGASGLFLAVAIADWVTTRSYTWITGRTSERMLFALRIQIFAQLQRLSLDFYDRELAGRIMTRMTTDVEALSQLVQTGLISAVVSVFTCAGVLVWLVVLSPPLALVAASVLPLLGGATWWYRRTSARSYSLARDRISALNANFQESLSGVRVAQAYRREALNLSRFRDVNGAYLDARLQSQRLIALYFPFVFLLADIGAAVVLGAGTIFVRSGVVTTGIVVAFLLYLDQFFSPIQQLSQVFDTWQQAAVSMNRITELMLTPTGTPSPARPLAPGRIHGDIAFDNVSFHYPVKRATDVIHGVDLAIPSGQTVALVGETGAGKSTMVKLIARFYDPDHGRVTVDGIDVRDFDLPAFRRQLGIVPQEAFLFTGTIGDNIAYGRPESGDAAVEAAARAVGAHEMIVSQPNGYLTAVTERGRSLSAGERQLIALARARLVDPAILLLDEATSNLDLASEAHVQRAMSRAADGRTTILVAHRLATARLADRIILIAGGGIAEQGTHDELIARRGGYAALWAAYDRAGDQSELARQQRG
jgi:ATP-binding cassette, subfamily B, bacterial